MTIHVTPIPSTIELAVPAFVLGEANAAGDTGAAVASNSTLLAFDTNLPDPVAASAVVGVATIAPRRDHVHIGVTPSAAVFSGDVDLGSNLLVGNAGSAGIAINSDGAVTMLKQPTVLAYNAATQTNVTGAGEYPRVNYATEVFDLAEDFNNTTSLFTASVEGRYLFVVQVTVYQTTDNHTYDNIQLITTDFSFDQNFSAGPGHTASLYGTLSITESVICYMDAGDTAFVVAQFNGGATVVDIAGSHNTFFSCSLLA